MNGKQPTTKIRADEVVDQRFVDGMFWFFAIAPFITAMPLFFLMPESLPSRVYPIMETEMAGSRWELFLIPLSWFIANVVMHVVFRLVERTQEKMSTRLATLRVATSVIFALLAIVMELFVYQEAMLSL